MNGMRQRLHTDWTGADERNVLIYDTDGATFDASDLRIEDCILRAQGNLETSR